MAKRKKRRQRPRKPRPARPPLTLDDPSVPRPFAEGVEQAQQLMKKKRWTEARELLESLDRRYPDQLTLLTFLVNVYFELQDIRRYQEAIGRLLEVNPHDPDAALGLAGSFLHTSRPVLALRAFRSFLERWPEHERAADVRNTVADLEETMPEVFAELGVADVEAGWELAVQHEELQVYLDQGRFSEMRRTAEAILERYPHFAPAYNNLSLADWMEGRLDRAIANAAQVLTFEPDNVHALSNLVHFLCVSGRRDEATSYADRLRASSAPASEKLLKQVEAFTYLGDDAAVWELFEQAAGTDERDERFVQPTLYHLVAVAAWRLGREDEARRLWQQALKVQRGFDLARENLDDLQRPVGERHAPWPFPASAWLSQEAWADLGRAMQSVSSRQGEEGARSTMRRFLKRHPEVVAALPLLLERGDPAGRELVLTLIRIARTPQVLETLKAFVLGPHGPDGARIQAGNLLREEDLLPAGPTRLFSHGEWQEMLLLGFEIGDESEDHEKYPPRVERMVEEATLALHAGDAQRAEELIRQALALRPESLTLRNNLAAAYGMQGQQERAEELIRDIHAQAPDYLFARVSVAKMAIRDGDTARAHELLQPLLQRKRLHFSEFDQLCGAFIELYLAQDNADAARTWFGMWESGDPENPQLALYRLRLGRLGRAMGRLLRR